MTDHDKARELLTKWEQEGVRPFDDAGWMNPEDKAPFVESIATALADARREAEAQRDAATNEAAGLRAACEAAEEFVHWSGLNGTLSERSKMLAQLRAALGREEAAGLRRQVDTLIAAWPDALKGGSGPKRYVWDVGQHEWYYQPGMKGPFPSREAAVRAAAGIEAEGVVQGQDKPTD